MTQEIKRRRGTTAQHASFTGANAETTVDTDKKTVVVHDGATEGGFPLARQDETAAALSQRVRFDGAQSKTPAEQGQARANIGAGLLAGLRNKLINGDFSINQREFGAVGTGFFADRWVVFVASGTATAQSIANDYNQDLPVSCDAYARLNVSVSGDVGILQNVESAATLAGRPVTLTFWTRTVSGSPTLDPILIQDFGTGGAPSSNEVQSIPVSVKSVVGAWTEYTGVASLPSIEGKTIGTNGDDRLVVRIDVDGATVVDFAHVSLVEGDASAEVDPCEQRPIALEKLLCNRYAQKGSFHLRGSSPNTSGANVSACFSIDMRGVPSVSFFEINYIYSCSGVGGNVSETHCEIYVSASDDFAFNTKYLLDAEY